jgi:hypothetical protein
MLRFLKYIFLIFGGLALGIMTFFFFNNKNDVLTALEYRSQLSYDGLTETCVDIKDHYHYPCFKQRFSEYVTKVSLTGVSIGLKLAFNAMDEDKENTKITTESKIKDMIYALNYLELNNLAINNAYKRFYGFEFTYGGYVMKLQDFFKKAYEFSDNLLKGLKGEEGLVTLKDESLKLELSERLKDVEKNYHLYKKEADAFMKVEVEKQEKKFQEYQNS